MAEYLIYFNQEWVGDHPQEWFLSRVEPSMAVIREMKEAGVYVYAGGLEEGAPAHAADATSGTTTVTDGPFTESTEVLGGLTVIDVPDEESAKYWAGRVAEGCGWPQELRRFGAKPPSRHAAPA